MKIDIPSRLRTIKEVLSMKSYLFLFSLLFVTYLTIGFVVNQFQETLPVFLSYNLKLVIPYVMFSIGTGFVVALNMTLIVYKIKQVRSVKAESGATAVGLFGGMLGGACPGCFVGLFPTLAGVFGASLTLGSLPFLGFELAIPAFLISLIALYVISNPLTCKIKK